MATEYSLLTALGLNTAVTLSTSTDAITLAAHGLPAGHAFRFDAASTVLPSIGGVQVGTATTYYVSSTSLAAGTFRISSLSDGSNALDITAAGTAVKIVGEYWASRDVTARARYGTAGSERVYGGIAAWETAINAAKDLTKDIVLEYQGRWTDGTNLAASLFGFKSITMWPKINGVWEAEALHDGTPGSGYANVFSNANRHGVNFTQPDCYITGLEIRNTNALATTYAAIYSGSLAAVNTRIEGCITQCGYGIKLAGPQFKVFNNIMINCLTCGHYEEQNVFSGVSAFNIAKGCAVGFDAFSSSTRYSNGLYVGNIAIGNTTNWATLYSPPVAGNRFVARHNFGVTGDAVWDTSSTAGVVAADGSDFVNYAGGDFHPALSASPQVELITVAEGDGLPRYDIADAVRPNYIDAVTDKADAGPFEFDHGNGLIPNFQNFTITGLVSGSRVKVKKTSGGTVIHNAIVNATSLTISYNAGASDTPVTIDIAKGAAAPYYYRYRTTASISYLGASGVSVAQIPDIAADTYPAGVAIDWSVNTTTKAITHTSGTTVYTVQDLYSWLAAYYDHADRVDLDMPMYGTTPDIFGLQNGGTISDADMQYLKGGSIMAGTTLWANVYSVGTQSASTPIYLHLDGAPVTSFWPTGNIDVLVKLPSYTGAEVLDVRAHKFSDTYDHWQMTLEEGRNVAAISTSDDPNNQTLEATVAGYSDITVTVNNPTGQQIDASDTAADYTTTIDGAGRTVAQIYGYLKYLTKQPSTYVSANAAYAEVKAAPYGTLAGGVFLCARGIWLTNAAAGDALNYILTDNAGVTHQAAVPPADANATVLAGSRVQLYNVTTGTEIDNVVSADTSYNFTISTQASVGDTLRLNACKKGYQSTPSFAVWSASGVTFLVSQPEETIYTGWGIDGATCTEFTLDTTGVVQIDANDVDGSSLKTRLGAWYNYILTTEDGIRYLYGAITLLAANAIRFNVDVLDLQIENINASTALKFTDLDVRLFRSDGSSIIALTSYSIHNDYSGVPDVAVVTVGGANIITGDIADISAGLTVAQDRLLKLAAAAAAGKVSGAASETVTIRDVDDTVNAITATVDAEGNRTAITYGI